MIGSGPGSANWVGDVRVSGRTNPSHGTSIGALAGGVGRQTPGAGVTVNGWSALRPSPTREAITAAAASSPTLLPCTLPTPSGTWASDAA